MAPIFRITDGTTTVNLIKQKGQLGFHLDSWRPNIPFYKGGGVFQDSSLSNGRQLVDKRFENHIETISLKANNSDQDSLIEEMQEIRRLLEKASSYWSTEWQTEPVWIEAKASNETNTRYAVIMTGAIQEDENPYSQPFLQPGCYAVMDNLTLVIEHLFWTNLLPGESECVKIAGFWSYLYPNYVEFDGADTILTIPDNAGIQDLHDDAMTVEAWIRPNSEGEGSSGRIVDKIGWLFATQPNNIVIAIINCAVSAGSSSCAIGLVPFDGETWTHVAFTWDDVTYNYPRVWVNGVESNNTTANRNGAVTSDVGSNLIIGNVTGLTRTFDGDIGWVRISNAVRYTADFTPPERCILPAIDSDTIGQWIGLVDSGIDIINQNRTYSAIDGVLADGTFGCDCETCYGNVVKGPAYLSFNGADNELRISQSAVINDLADDAFTAEGWFMIDGPGGGAAEDGGRLFEKGQSSNRGWGLLTGDTVRFLYAIIQCASQDAIAIASQASYPYHGDNTWHHIAMTWDDASYNYPRIWIDGEEATYSSTQNRNGAIVADAVDNLFVGGNNGGTRVLDGKIGWIRISDVVRYTATFTPPVRCFLPDVDSNTVVLEIYEGTGDTTYDLSGNNKNGSLTFPLWGNDCATSTCEPDYSCIDMTYITNKHTRANITHIFNEDFSGGIYSPNLAGVVNFNLFPAVMGASDRVYFGIETGAATPSGGYYNTEAGPFNSLVFDLGVAASDITDIDWEYWDGGAWSALSVQDNTNDGGEGLGIAFDTTGVSSVHWIQPSDWARTTVNGVIAYWVRAEIQGVGAAPVSPQQQNHPVYTITWPFVEISSTGVSGDISALTQIKIKNESDVDFGVDQPELGFQRLVAGLRTASRGENFTPYINLSDTQNPENIDVSILIGTIDDDVESPTGYVMRSINPGTLGLAACSVEINEPLLEEYNGKYHVFLRGKQDNGSAGDIDVVIKASIAGTEEVWVSPTRSFENTSSWQVLDFGSIDIQTKLAGQDAWLFSFSIIPYGNSSTDCRFYDLILMPVDEWAIDTNDLDRTSSNGIIGSRGELNRNSYLNLDAISNIKQFSSTAVIESIERWATRWKQVSIDKPIVQSNQKQRLWFFCTRFASSTVERADIEISNSVNVNALARYLSMRGAR